MPRRTATLSGAGHKSQPTVDLDAQLARLAERQHLVFTLCQLGALGLGRAAVAARAKRGRLHRVHQAVYALVPPSQLTVHGRYLAAVLACGGPPPAAASTPRVAGLSHRSVGDLHGLLVCHRRAVEVIVTGRTVHRHPGIEVHRSLHLDPARDITTVDGIPATTIPRTLLDLAAVVGRRALERALDRAEQLRVFDLRALEDQLRRNPGHPGAGRLGRALATHTAGDTITDSELEERMYALVRPTGSPRPEFHGPIDPGDGGVILRPDVVWYEARLAVEVDGRGSHLTRRAFEQDRRRDQRLTAAGWRVIRVTWRQLTEEPGWVMRLLGDLLGDSAAA